MTSEQNEIINSLKLAIDKLKEKCDQLANDNADMNTRYLEALKIVEDQQTVILEQKEQINTLKVAKAFSGSENTGSQEAKLMINKIVREIDKCIALANK